MTASPEADRALVEACIRGEPAARRALVVRFYRPVKQSAGYLPVARRGRVTSADVEDAVQYAFLTLFARDAEILAAWRGAASLSTYVRKVAERLVLRHLQRSVLRRGRFMVDLDGAAEPEEVFADDAPLAEAVIADAGERARLREAILARLTEKGRELYRHLYVEEMDVATTAKLCGITPNNVYQWRNRILRVAHEVRAAVEAEEKNGPGVRNATPEGTGKV